jgi:hypothetical protein
MKIDSPVAFTTAVMSCLLALVAVVTGAQPARAAVSCTKKGPRIKVLADHGFARASVRAAFLQAVPIFFLHDLVINCNRQGRVRVDRVDLKRDGKGFRSKLRQLDRAGLNNPDRLYLLFTRGSVGCSSSCYVGRSTNGDRGELKGPQYSMVTERDPYLIAHELFHTMGIGHKENTASIMHPSIGWRVGKWYRMHLCPQLLK